MRDMLRGLALPFLLAATLVVTPATAQGTDASFVIDAVTVPDAGLPAQPDGTAVEVAWTYRFSAAAFGAGQAATEASRIDWTLACDSGQVLLLNASTPLEPDNWDEVRGTSRLEATATPETLDGTACTLTGQPVSDSPAVPGGNAHTVEVAMPIRFHPRLTLEVMGADRQASPQKQIPFPVEMTNHGNARTVVLLEVLQEPQGKWAVLLPDPIVLEPGEARLAIVNVATPFENGWVSEDGPVVVQATPVLARDNAVRGEPIRLEMHASAKGWYVPGPSAGLVLGGLALLAVAARRR